MPLDSDDDDTMTPAGDHDAWSERLLEFTRGELDRARSEELEAHLRSCVDCRAELVAVRALLDAPDAPMTEVERAALHAALQDTQQAANVVPLAPRPRSERPLMRRLAPALGAAALLLIGGVAVLQSHLLEGSDGPVDAVGGGGGAALERVTSEALRAKRFLGRPKWLGDLGRTSLDKVADLARSNSSVGSVRKAYGSAATSDQKVGNEMALTDVLAPQAPAQLRGPMRSCIDEVTSQFGDVRLLPAVGAQGRLEGKEVLFVGFVTSSSGRRPDQLAVWAFEPRTCTPLGYQASDLAGSP